MDGSRRARGAALVSGHRRASRVGNSDTHESQHQRRGNPPSRTRFQGSGAFRSGKNPARVQGKGVPKGCSTG